MPQFNNTEYFNYALSIPIGLVLLWLFWRWRQKQLNGLAAKSILDIIFPGHQRNFSLVSGLLILSALAFVILALANPIGAVKPIKGHRNGIDIAIALDLSKSMDAQDVKPSRLERAIQFISSLNSKLEGDRVGLVVFAGNAYVQMPLTSDLSAMKLFLGNLNTNVITEQGTAIGEALETSTTMLLPNGQVSGPKNASKVILLITDGENHDNIAIDKAREAEKKGIIIYSIGVGSESGALIPLYEHGMLQNYLKNNKDEAVISKLDPETLNEIAASANGSFFRLSDQDNLMPTLLNKLNTLKKGEQDFKIYDTNETMFQWFAAVALFLLLLESLLNFRRPGKSIQA